MFRRKKGSEEEGGGDSQNDSLTSSKSGTRKFREQFIALVRFCATPVATAAWAFYLAHSLHPKTDVTYLAMPALALGVLMFMVRPFESPREVPRGSSVRRVRIERISLYVLLDMLVFPFIFGHILRGILPDQLVTNLTMLALGYICCRFFLAPLGINWFFKKKASNSLSYNPFRKRRGSNKSQEPAVSSAAQPTEDDKNDLDDDSWIERMYGSKDD